MKLLILFLISCAVAQDIYNEKILEVPCDPKECEFQDKLPATARTGRMSYGNKAVNTQYPFVARMTITERSGKEFLCTGSLIAANWILGARHCIDSMRFKSIKAALGSADSENPSRVRVCSDRVYLKCVSDGNYPDIALYHLMKKLTLNSYVNIVQLPSRSQAKDLFEGMEVVSVGWGADANGTLPRYLQWGNFSVVKNSKILCSSEKMLLTPLPGNRTSIEGGDSGGPVLIYDKNNVPTIIGIGVFYFRAYRVRYSGATRVTKFLNYISDVTGIARRN